MRNSVRYDLSDRLVHFFRKIELESGDCPSLPAAWGFNSLENLSEPLSPFFMLRSAVRQGKIWATWSVRGGKRTIYGADPAICFTEMPIAAFIETGIARAARGQAMSPYGLIFPKNALFDLGARPVIYALSGEITETKSTSGERIIADQQLPRQEQYRYVTYQPTSVKPIDWTHEREWRWPCRGTLPPTATALPPQLEDLHGLDIDSGAIEGIGAIVKTRDQASRLIYDILTKVDRGNIAKGKYAFVLVLNALSGNEALRERSALEEAINEGKIDLEKFFAMSKARATRLHAPFRAEVKRIAATSTDVTLGTPGACWLWLLDNTHELTRALIKLNKVLVNRSGKYLVALPDFEPSIDLGQREQMTLKLARRLRSEFGLRATYLSTPHSEDPDFPGFNTDESDDRKYFNHSDKVQDY